MAEALDDDPSKPKTTPERARKPAGGIKEEEGEEESPTKKARKSPKVKKEASPETSASDDGNGKYAFDSATGTFSVADSSTAVGHEDGEEA